MKRPITKQRIAFAESEPRDTSVVLYARVSSKDQEREGFSIPAQEGLLREYASKQGFSIVHEFVDVETAKQSGRKAFGEMLVFLQKNPCAAVLVEKTDRLTRNLKDVVLLDELIRDGLELHFVKENNILSRDSRSHEKFIHGIKVLMAKNFVDNLSEEVRKGMRQKADEGLWPGQAPVGYVNVRGPSGKKIIAPDPDMAERFRRVAAWFAEGGGSLLDAVAKAREEGLRTRRGGLLPRSTIHQMLRNPIYAGDFFWNGKLYSGKHEPLISKEMHQRIVDILDGRFEKRHRKAKRDFAYARLIGCGHCGCALVGEIKKGKYVYYRCTHYKTKCADKHVREEVLEEKFAEVVRGLEFDRETCDWVAQGLRASHVDARREHEEAIARLQAEHTKLQNRIDTMYLDKLDGKITTEFFDEKSAEWRSEQANLRTRIAAHVGANTSYIEDGIRLLELARRSHELFRRQPPSEKRKMLNLLLSNSRWKHGALLVTYRQPFDMLAKTIARVREVGAADGDDPANSEIWYALKDSNL